MIDDKVRIRCPFCTRMFRDRASRIRQGYQVNCGDCNRLITFSSDTEDPHLRRALKAARDIRLVCETERARATGSADRPG